MGAQLAVACGRDFTELQGGAQEPPGGPVEEPPDAGAADLSIWHQGGALMFHPGDSFSYLTVGDERPNWDTRYRTPLAQQGLLLADALNGGQGGALHLITSLAPGASEPADAGASDAGVAGADAF